MNMRTIHVCALVALVALPLSAALFAGCGSADAAMTDCLSLCDESNNCPGAAMTDCTSSCALAATLNTDAGCAMAYQDVLTCAAAQSDVCTAPMMACSTELSAYTACIEAYCMQTPRPAACNTTG